jgi:hypothetical protein
MPFDLIRSTAFRLFWIFRVAASRLRYVVALRFRFDKAKFAYCRRYMEAALRAYSDAAYLAVGMICNGAIASSTVS